MNSDVPGVVVNHLPASTRQYIGSPSIAVLPNGEYVASHDLFGPRTNEDRTLVFASADRGATWHQRAEIEGQFWSTLFVHQGCLYLIGTSRQEGFAVIRRSEDGGRTWTTPRDRTCGLLLDDARYHCAPVPVVAYRGRLWRAMEDAMGGGGWAKHFRAFMMSASLHADLLRAESWTCSNRLARQPEWLDGKFGGWLEGNAVVTPEGRVVNILRVDCPEHPERAAIVYLSDDGTRATFDPITGFIEFPGGAKKFTIRYDPISRCYWSLTNYVPEAYRYYQVNKTRNTLALIRSHDLRHWEIRAILLHHPDPVKHAFQYVDWLIEGEDLIAVSRTAYDDGMGGAHNQHDANFLTFHRFRGFRQRNTGIALPS